MRLVLTRLHSLGRAASNFVILNPQGPRTGLTDAQDAGKLIDNFRTRVASCCSYCRERFPAFSPEWLTAQFRCHNCDAVDELP